MTTYRSPAIPARLFEGGRGVLVLDEERAVARRLRRHGIAGTADIREELLRLIAHTPELARHLSGLQLTPRAWRTDGVDVPDRMMGGIRADSGAQPVGGHGGEAITRGLDGLPQRLERWAAAGFGFAAWRTVYVIDDRGPRTRPSPSVMRVNADTTARFARYCRDAGMVPLIESDVLPDGRHDAQRSAEVGEAVLAELCRALDDEGVHLHDVALAITPACAGIAVRHRRGGGASAEVAEATSAMLAGLPAAPGALGYLCGSTPYSALAGRLGALGGPDGPGPAGFVVGRTVLDAVLSTWNGERARVVRGRQALVERLVRLHLAVTGGAARVPADGVPAR